MEIAVGCRGVREVRGYRVRVRGKGYGEGGIRECERWVGVS